MGRPQERRVSPPGLHRAEEHAQIRTQEFKLLHLRAANPGRIFNREYLLERIWGDDCEVLARTVDTHMLRLCKKLGGGSGLQRVSAQGRLKPAPTEDVASSVFRRAWDTICVLCHSFRRLMWKLALSHVLVAFVAIAVVLVVNLAVVSTAPIAPVAATPAAPASASASPSSRARWTRWVARSPSKARWAAAAASRSFC